MEQTIFGLGGVGKTQIAIEYAHQCVKKDTYKDAIWILSAETEETLRASCLKFAEKLGLIPEGISKALNFSTETISDRLKAWLSSHSSWLLVFDNVEKREIIKPYIPGVQTGDILITTRIREVGRRGRLLELERFEPEEAVNFIHTRLADNLDLISDKSSVITLVERLGRFPLALEQAAAFIQSTETPCSNYLELLATPSRMVETLKSESSACVTDYQSNVIDTLALAFEKLDKHESAKQLLNLCAYMSSDAIPLDFFEKQREVLLPPLSRDLEDKRATFEVVAQLLNYSLVQRNENLLSIHRLVQEVRCEQLKGDTTDWLQISVDAMLHELSAIDDYGYRKHRDRYEHIAAHAESIAGHLDNAYIDNADNIPQIALLYHKIGDGCYRFTRYDQALMWYIKELELLENVLEKEHINITEVTKKIASTYFMLNDLDKAKELHDKVLETYKDEQGTNHILTARAYNAVASVHARRGEYKEAFESYQKSLDIMEALKADGRDIAGVYNNIGWTHQQCKDYPEARKWYKMAFDIRKEIYGSEDHTDIALIHYNAAETYYEEKDYDTALAFYLQSYQMRRNVLTNDHPHTKCALEFLENIYRDKLGYTEPFEEWLDKQLEEQAFVQKLGDFAI